MVIQNVNFIMIDTVFLKPVNAFKESSLPLVESKPFYRNYLLCKCYLTKLGITIERFFSPPR
jgi:hypothetical protein